MDPLTITVDVAEPRILVDRLAATVTGAKEGRLQWDYSSPVCHQYEPLATSGSALFPSVLTDPATFTAFLTPVIVKPLWDTASKQGYLIRKADTDRAGSALWLEVPGRFAQDTYLFARGTVQPINTLAAFEKNMPWAMSYYAYGQGDSFAQFDVTFGSRTSTGTADGAISLRFYTDNEVEIYKYSASGSAFNYVGSLNLSMTADAKDRMETSRRTTKDNNQDNYVFLSIIPCRKRELLIFSNRGGWGNFAFPDIDKDDPNPTILPSGPVGWYHDLAAEFAGTAGPQIMFQAAPAKKAGWSDDFFNTAGTILSGTIELRQAPSSGATAVATAYWDPPYYGSANVTPSVVRVDGTTAFVGDGTTTLCRLRAVLNGDGHNTPFLYGVSAYFAAETQDTVGTASVELVQSGYAMEVELNVPDSPSGVTLNLTIKDVDAAGVAKIRKLANRPCVAKIGSQGILRGRTGAPRFTLSSATKLHTVKWEIRDEWKSLEQYMIRDPEPDDGLLLEAAGTRLVRLPGYGTAEVDIEGYGFPIPSQGQSSQYDFAEIAEAGQSAADRVLHYHETYAGRSLVGWRPSTTPGTARVFRMKTPEACGTVSQGTLWAAVGSVNTGTPDGTANPWRYVYNSFTEEAQEAICNDITVTGWDSRVDKAFRVHYEDLNSKDPDAAPAARSDNWLGEPRYSGVFDPALTRLSEANYILGVLRQRWIDDDKRHAEWACQFQQIGGTGVPFWPGDLMTLAGQGIYRIKTLNGKFEVEQGTAGLHGTTPAGTRNWVWRPFSYSGDFYGTV